MAPVNRRQILAGAAVLALLCEGAACRRPGKDPGRAASAVPPARLFDQGASSLLLITIDTWRWDYLGASGAGRVETPNLDRLAREGIFEREAVTPCPLTTPAHASILTGLDPARHRVWDCALYTLPETIPTLAEDFHAAGFTTTAFVASETLNRRFGLHRGFGTYDEVAIRAEASEEWWTASRDGSEVTGAFLSFLRSQPADARLFAWVHYYDAHLPYRPRPDLDGRYPKDPYAAQVAFIDGEVGKLLSALREGGREWRVVVVGDHGEGLGDRGEITHGIGLYRSTLHVPLIIYPKPEKPLAHPKPWGLVDLRSTLLEWYGLPAARAGDGESLFSGEGKERVLYAVSLLPTLFFSADPSLGVRRGANFYLRHSAEELFDLDADPGEERDVNAAPAAADALKVLRELCNHKWPRNWYVSVLPSARRPSSEEARNLRSLGYIGGGPPAAAKIRSAAIGRMMKDHSDWELAREAVQASGRSDRLLELFPRLVGRYPDSFALRKDYGTRLGKAGRTREAIRQFEAAARLFAGDSVVLGNLGALYLEEGRIEAARSVLEESVAIDPDMAGPQKNLGIVYLDYLHQPDKAILHFKKYLEAGGDAESERIRAFIQNSGQAGAAEAH
jgi:arylsulfatase A-like enzyme